MSNMCPIAHVPNHPCPHLDLCVTGFWLASQRNADLCTPRGGAGPGCSGHARFYLPKHTTWGWALAPVPHMAVLVPSNNLPTPA